MTETFSQEIVGEARLPEGWAFADLGALLDVIRGISFPSTAKRFEPEDGYIACLRTTNVQRDVEWENLWFVPEEHVKRNEQLVKPLDILISTANSFELVGKVAQVQQMPVKATLGAFISLIRVPSYLDAKYFYFYLSSGETQERIRKLASTTTNISNVSTKKLKTLTLRVPPLNEQRRIVEKIEELFTKLDAGIRSLKQVREQLKSYRRSVLKAAVEGELSREWREAHRDEIEPASELLERILQERQEKFPGKRYKELAYPDTAKLPALPAGWAWAQLQAISDALGGFAFKSKDYSDAGYQVLKIGNVNPGQFDLAERPSYIHKVEPEILEKYLLRTDDVVISLTGSRGKRDYGFVALVKQQQNLLLNQRVARLRFSTLLNAQYCSLALQGENFQNQFFRYETGNVGQGNISMKALKETYVPLPPFKEQRFVVEEVERRLSVVDKQEATVEESLKQAGGLRQSILKQAFSGELVPQDPDDEPASVLLKRIREERQATKQTADEGRSSKISPSKSGHADQGGLF